MSRKNYGLVISGDTGGIDNDTATKKFDSREFTFKYLDRKLYGNGVFSIPQTYSGGTYPYPVFPVPHNLGYYPSYRLYTYVRDANNDYAGAGNQYELEQTNGGASVANVGGYVSKSNFYIYVKDLSNPIAGSQVYFVFLIGADNLEADADETRYIA